MTSSSHRPREAVEILVLRAIHDGTEGQSARDELMAFPRRISILNSNRESMYKSLQHRQDSERRSRSLPGYIVRTPFRNVPSRSTPISQTPLLFQIEYRVSNLVL